MLSIHHLSCYYDDRPVLVDLNLKVLKNRKLFIVGANGSGKTTLLKTIAGLIPYKGEICLNGHNLATLNKKERSKKMALLSQVTTLYFSYSVYETVMQGRYAHLKDSFFRGESKTDKEIVLDCLERTGLIDLKDRSIRQLSGGQLQRVFLARIFAQQPDIILLDEPTNHLDLRYQLELMDYLDDWVYHGSRMVIGVVHDMNLALSFANDLLMLKAGRIFSQSTPKDLDLNVINQTFDADVTSFMQRALKAWER